MKKILLSLCFTFTFFCSTFSQVYQQWTKTVGSSSASESAQKLTTDILGNVYTIGSFSNLTIMGSDTLFSAGKYDVYISKFNSSGVLQWTRRAGGIDDDFGYDIAVSGTSVYITGYFNGTANFNTPSASGSNEIVSAGGRDIFIAKYNLSGTFQWVKRAGGTSFDVGNAIAAVGNEIYITGYFAGTANFNTPSSGSNNTILANGSSNDIFLAKYDNNGNFLWAKRAGSSDSDWGQNIVANANEVYITGFFRLNANFNTPSATGSNEVISAGGNDIFIAKYNTSGDIQWIKRAGGVSDDDGSGIELDGTSVYLSGNFKSVANFNTPSSFGTNELVCSGFDDAFLAKYDNLGNLVWEKRMGGGNNLYGGTNDINDLVCINSVIYLVGKFFDEINFNTPSSTTTNNLLSSQNEKTDAFFAKFDADGNYLWSKRLGGLDSYDDGKSIATYGKNIYFLGGFNKIINLSSPYVEGVDEFDTKENHVYGANAVLIKFQENESNFEMLQSSGSANVGSEQAKATVTDDEGNVYFTGSFLGTITLGTFNLTSAGGSDIFIAKANRAGEIQWAKRAGGTGDDVGYGIDYYSNEVYITGSFRSTANFNTPSSSGSNELISEGGNDIFIAKYLSSNGNLATIKRAGGNGSDIGYAIAVNGFIFITGSFEGTANFNTPSNPATNTLTSAGGADIFLAAFASDFTLNFIKRAGGTGEDIANGIDLYTSIYITGSFEGTANFNTPSSGASNTLISAGDTDIFIAKFAITGVLEWIKRGGGTGADVANAIKYYSSYIYITGNFNDIANFNTPSSSGSNELTSIGLRDAFIAKFDANGSVQWLKRAGGTNNDSGNGIDVNSYGVYVVGGFRLTANFNTPSASGSNELTVEGGRDMYVAKFDHTGIFEWARRGGGSTEDLFNSIALFNRDVIAVGFFEGTANFNTPSASGSKELVSNGDEDICFTKIIDDHTVISWVKSEGVTAGGSCDGIDVATDPSGNVYSVNIYNGAILVNNQIFIAESTSESILIKYDKNGKVLWAKRFGGLAQSISCDANAVYITGYFSNTINFNTPSNNSSNQLIASSNQSMFVAKFNSSGVFQWAKQAGNTTIGNNTVGEDIVVSSNSVYVTGYFIGTINFNTPSATGSNELTSMSGTYTDAFIAKYNQAGNLQWIRRAGSSGIDNGRGIVVLGTDVYIVGDFNGTANFNTPSAAGSNEITALGGQDAFLAKFSSNGTFQWAKRAGGTGTDVASGIDTDGTNLYVSGYFQNTADFNTPSNSGSNTIVSAGGYDGFVSKFDNSGTFQWARRFGGSSYDDYCYGINTDGTNVLLVGYFEGTINFNTPSNTGSNSLVSAGGRDILLANFNTSGTFQWAERAGASTSPIEQSNAVEIFGSKIYVAGDLADPGDFSFGGAVVSQINPIDADAFLSALEICITSINLQNPTDNITGANTNQLASATNGTITATNQISNTSQVNYKAKSIMLNAGFKADSGTTFTAQVGGCSQ